MTDEPIGCGDNSCIFNVIRPHGGMGTNGGCRCFEELVKWLGIENRWNREEVGRVRRDTQRLVQEIRRLREENDKLRAIIAKSDLARAEVAVLRALVNAPTDEEKTTPVEEERIAGYQVEKIKRLKAALAATRDTCDPDCSGCAAYYIAEKALKGDAPVQKHKEKK